MSSKRRILIIFVVAAAVVGIMGLIHLIAHYQTEIKLNPASWRHLPDSRFVGKVMEDAYVHREEGFSTWYGVEMLQYPTDLMTYQEIITEARPDFVIETGTLSGGLTLFLATVLEGVASSGIVITIDIEPRRWTETVTFGQFDHELLNRIRFLQGDSSSPIVFKTVAEMVQGGSVLVILDSLHSKDHVYRELQLYSQLVSPGSYVLVNDTSLGGTFLDDSWDLRTIGPLYGVQRFLAENADFELAHDRQRFSVSCMHSGILRRVR